MSVRRIQVDFQNSDALGRVRLNCQGTLDDLNRHRVRLVDGVSLILYNDDVEVEGEVCYSEDEHLWVAEIDWNGFLPLGSIQQQPVTTPR